MIFFKQKPQPSVALIELAESVALLKVEVSAIKKSLENLEADLSKAKYKKIIKKEEKEEKTDPYNGVLLPEER